jgi:hypothetical protein
MKNYLKTRQFQSTLVSSEDYEQNFKDLAKKNQNFFQDKSALSVFVVYVSGVCWDGKIPMITQEQGLVWEDLGLKISKIQGKIGRVVLLMDLLELGTDQAKLRELSHNVPEYYPFHLFYHSDPKKFEEMYEMHMLTHSILEKTWRIRGMDQGSYFTELF